MWAGVGKSGSPAPKPITGSPAAFSALALASTARVADSAMAATRAEMRCSDMSEASRTARRAGEQLVGPAAAVRRAATGDLSAGREDQRLAAVGEAEVAGALPPVGHPTVEDRGDGGGHRVGIGAAGHHRGHHRLEREEAVTAGDRGGAPWLQPVNTATDPSSANTSVGGSTPAGTLDAVSPEAMVCSVQVVPVSTGVPVAEVPPGPPVPSASSTVTPSPVSEMPSAVVATVGPEASHA